MLLQAGTPPTAWYANAHNSPPGSFPWAESGLPGKVKRPPSSKRGSTCRTAACEEPEATFSLTWSFLKEPLSPPSLSNRRHAAILPGGIKRESTSGSRRLRLPVRKHGGASQRARRRRRRRRSGIVAAAFLRAREFPAAAPELAGPPSGEKGDDRRSLASPTPSFGLVDGRPRGNPKGIVVVGGVCPSWEASL